MTGVVPHDGSKNSKKLKPTAHQLTAHAAGFDARAAVSTRMQLYAGLAGISVDGGLGSRCASAHAYQRSSCRDARGVYVYDLMSNHAMHLLLSGSVRRLFWFACVSRSQENLAPKRIQKTWPIHSRTTASQRHSVHSPPLADRGREQKSDGAPLCRCGTSLRAKHHVCE